MAYINKYGMLEGDNPEEQFELRNPNARARILGGGTIGNPTKYYDPNEQGNANWTESMANAGRAIQRGPTQGTFGQFFRNSQTPQSRAERGELGGLGAQPDIAKQVLAQVLPDLPKNTLLGQTTPISLALGNGTTQSPRSLSDMAGGTNHATEWMGGVQRLAKTDDDTIENDPFRKAFGGGLPTPTPKPTPSRFARFDFRSGIRNSLRTPAYEDDDEIVKFRSRYGFGSGLNS